MASPKCSVRDPRGQAQEGIKFVGLDGLRGFAALCVVALHTANFTGLYERFFHGYIAVDLFFMISGFVVAHAYEKRLISGSLSFRNFAVLRLKRLLPLAMIGTILGFLAILIAPDPAFTTEQAIGFLEKSILLLPQRALGNIEAFPLNGVLWSLLLEIVGNLVYAALVKRLSTVRLAALALASLAVVGLFSMFAGNTSYGWQSRLLFAGAFRFIYAFPAGLILYRKRALLQHWSDRISVVGIGGLCLILLTAFIGGGVIPMGWRSGLFDTLVLAFVLPLIVVGGVSLQPNGLLSSICVISGGGSYALYATHWPLLMAAKRADIPYIASLAMLAAVFVVALIADRLFDRPIQRFLRKPRDLIHLRVGRATPA